MESFLLREGVLNDDALHIAPKGKVFKGGYKAIVEFYTFQNAWCNRKNLKRFRSIDSLNQHLLKNYPEFEFQPITNNN